MLKSILLVALLMLSPGVSFACRCAGWSDEQQFDLARTVFVATVTSIHVPIAKDRPQYQDSSLDGEHGPSLGPVRIRFQVEETIKGNPREVPFLQTGYGSGDCGVKVRVAHRYIFFPDRWGYISICTGEGIAYDPLNPDHVKFLNRMKARAISPHIPDKR